MLYRGETLGDGSAPNVDIAVDPLDGTTLCATGRSGAVAVRALKLLKPELALMRSLNQNK